MPWQANGTFLRINPDFTGQVWAQDQQATIKIVATRHDFHDQDIADGIANALSLDGYNTMRAAIKMGNSKITGMANGTGAADAVTLFQLDEVETKVDANTAAIQEIGVQGDIITAQSWDGAELKSTRTNGDFDTDLHVMNATTSYLLRIGDTANNGVIRQKIAEHGTGTGIESIDVMVAGRHHISNDGAFQIDLDLTGVILDAELDDDYEQEGMIIIDNLATPGTITLGTAGEVIGTQTLNANLAQILSYFIQRRGGTNSVYYVWSAP